LFLSSGRRHQQLRGVSRVLESLGDAGHFQHPITNGSNNPASPDRSCYLDSGQVPPSNRCNPLYLRSGLRDFPPHDSIISYQPVIMPSTNRSCKSAQVALASIFLFSVIPIAASLNPSDQPQYNIRRRSGSPADRSANFGPISKRDTSIPLHITNSCGQTLWPGIGTQAGTGPGTGGFELASGATKELTVGADWQGRVWGRTNCSFNALGTGASNLNGNNGGGRACASGDCGGVLSCVLTVSTNLF
jgi:hypothetical protein